MPIHPSDERPNIIFIVAESMDGRFMGPAGHRPTAGATPALNRLAESGVVFTNAYSNCPVCNPSRASLWTGQYPHYYDCWNNHEGLRPGTPTLFDVLKSAGYDTHAVGPLDYAYGMHSIRDRIGSWTRAAEVLRPISRTPLPVVSDDIDFFKRDRAWTEEALSILKRQARGHRPFFLYLTTGLVHPAFQAHSRHMDMIDSSAIRIPPTLGELSDSAHPAVRYMRTTKHCESRFSEPLVHEMRHVYSAMVAALDEQIGRVLDQVDEQGLADNTYVVFSSDHGEMAGEQNQILKRSMYEPSIHVPLIVRGPGVRRGERCEDPVSLVDIYPTFVDLGKAGAGPAAAGDASGEAAGVAPAGETAGETAGGSAAPVGESLLPQLCSGAARSQDWVFSEYHGDRCVTGTYMLRRGRWKYIRYEGLEPMLYDVESDPWEQHDLAAARPKVTAELDALLVGEFDCTGIDARAKEYDRSSFLEWRERARADGSYEETMSRVYSGFDRLCIEDIVPWRDEDEAKIAAWLGSDY